MCQLNAKSRAKIASVNAPLVDFKPMSYDLVHASPWQCMFALSMCIL